jgi:hypothetical protein
VVFLSFFYSLFSYIGNPTFVFGHPAGVGFGIFVSPIISVFLFITGIMLLKLRPWARTAAISSAVVYSILRIFDIFFSWKSVVSSPHINSFSYFFWEGFFLLLILGIGVYLFFRQTVREVFRRKETSSQNTLLVKLVSWYLYLSAVAAGTVLVFGLTTLGYLFFMPSPGIRLFQGVLTLLMAPLQIILRYAGLAENIQGTFWVFGFMIVLWVLLGIGLMKRWKWSLYASIAYFGITGLGMLLNVILSWGPISTSPYLSPWSYLAPTGILSLVSVGITVYFLFSKQVKQAFSFSKL